MMTYGEIINKSSIWDKQSPYLSQNELISFEDLTENDIIVRQINCSKILDRMIKRRLKDEAYGSQPFSFDSDFYG